MRSRVSFVVIALLNAPSILPLIVISAVLAGWVAGVLILPGPEDALVRWLSLLAATGGLATLAGHFLGADLQQFGPRALPMHWSQCRP